MRDVHIAPLHITPQSTTLSALLGLLGGACLALAASAHLLLRGRITGISGICAALSSPFLAPEKRHWRVAFLAGMGVASALVARLLPEAFAADAQDPSPLAAFVAGALVGAGTKLGSGCTSGHGVCGLPRFSRRSLVAVCTFMAVGVITASTIGALGLRPALTTPAPPSAALSGAVAAAAAMALAVLIGGRTPAANGKDELAPREHVDAALSAGLGALFAVGLSVSGMARPSRVLGFLDPFSRAGWDPTLACVLGGALAVNVCTFGLILRRSRPLLARAFELPTARDVTPSLLVGSATFGLGWGLAGVCPGPAIVILGAGKPVAVAFVAALLGAQAATEAAQACYDVAPAHAVVAVAPALAAASGADPDLAERAHGLCVGGSRVAASAALLGAGRT
ncbi:hypothetical protein KFE25_009495 [Diacronema lutheri]|uniref:Sulphur transport domain-containing protein n=1 Tax=Diacronema lutheri TaxID=2081491 RepID=A0A8J5XUX3_DIALT|nr:hypothetical protein KFE25_009495 [Diacronema lutheri]